MMMLRFSVLPISCVSAVFNFSSFIIRVFRSLSSRMTKLLVLAYSVRLMYKASSLAASCLARVVFPVQGVPVMSMTRFMSLFGWVVVIIGFGFCFSGRVSCALGFCRISPSSKLFLFCCFSPLCTCDFTKECRVRAGYLNPHEIDQFTKKPTNPVFSTY